MKIQTLNNNFIQNTKYPVFKGNNATQNALTDTQKAFLLSTPEEMDTFLSAETTAKTKKKILNPFEIAVEKVAKMFDLLTSNKSAKKIFSTNPEEIDEGFEYLYTQIYTGI